MFADFLRGPPHLGSPLSASRVLSNPDAPVSVLLYHIVPRKVPGVQKGRIFSPNEQILMASESVIRALEEAVRNSPLVLFWLYLLLVPPLFYGWLRRARDKRLREAMRHTHQP